MPRPPPPRAIAEGEATARTPQTTALQMRTHDDGDTVAVFGGDVGAAVADDYYDHEDSCHARHGSRQQIDYIGRGSDVKLGSIDIG